MDGTGFDLGITVQPACSTDMQRFERKSKTQMVQGLTLGSCLLQCNTLKGKQDMDGRGFDLGITVQPACSTDMHITRQEAKSNALGCSNLLALLHHELSLLRKHRSEEITLIYNIIICVCSYYFCVLPFLSKSGRLVYHKSDIN